MEDAHGQTIPDDTPAFPIPERAKRPSQCERILDLLSDGRFHSHHELYALGCIAHSRLAELRERGHAIEQRRVTVNGRPVWEYRLTSRPEHPHSSEQPEAKTEAINAACAREIEDAQAGEGHFHADSQLSIFEAA
jgi:hypothetical protein